MSLKRQISTDDDSKTLEQSVIIHGDQSTTTGGVEVLINSKSMQKNSDNKENKLSPVLGPTKPSSNGSSHRREVSVGTLIPTRLLTQAPSLIALLDSSKAPGSSRPASSRYNVPPAQSIIPSKSMPDFIAHAGNNTPSLASDGM